MAKLGLGDIQNLLDGSVASTASQMIQTQRNLIPKLTTTARDALTGTDVYEGLVIYNLTTHKLNVRVAAAWEAVTSA